MRKHARFLWHLLPASVLFFGGTAAAQGRTAVTGQVTDSSAQQPLAGAEVLMVGDGGATLRGARTDAAGRYLIANVPPGQQRGDFGNGTAALIHSVFHQACCFARGANRSDAEFMQ